MAKTLGIRTLEVGAAAARALAASFDALAPRGATDEERAGALAPIGPLVEQAARALAGPEPELIRLRGLPVDALDRGRPLPHATPRADALLHAIARALGREPMVYAEAGAGPVQDVFPRAGSLDKPHAHGAASIRWHVDGAGYPRDLVPDRMGLLGIENEPRAPTAFTSVAEVLRALDPATVRVLEQPCFRYCLPVAGGGVDRTRFTPWLALVHRPAHGPPTTGMFPYVLPRPGTSAGEAIAALERAASRVAVRSVIERGDLVLWANGPVMHARDAIPGAGQGAIRWLKRLFAIPVSEHNRAALGPDHVLRVDDALLERLTPRYRA